MIHTTFWKVPKQEGSVCGRCKPWPSANQFMGSYAKATGFTASVPPIRNPHMKLSVAVPLIFSR